MTCGSDRSLRWAVVDMTVVLHQPDHQPGIPRRQLVATAELLGVDRAQLRMVAAATLAMSW